MTQEPYNVCKESKKFLDVQASMLLTESRIIFQMSNVKYQMSNFKCQMANVKWLGQLKTKLQNTNVQIYKIHIKYKGARDNHQNGIQN